MRIGILHGYELTGSGSNEYCRYLSRTLALAGHEVQVLCREPQPEAIAHVTRAFEWRADGTSSELFDADSHEVGGGTSCTVHVLPDTPIKPVFLTDKQRSGVVKSYLDLSDEELFEYHELTLRAVRAALDAHPVDLLHVNHLIWQPRIASELDIPCVVFPHGSSIEYVVRHDRRYLVAARAGLAGAAGIVSGNREVLQRIFDLFPEDRTEFEAKSRIAGVGVDTRLFVPVPREEREASISLLRDKPKRSGGKRAELSAELRERTRAKDYEALTDYRDAYTQAAPDEDYVERLGSIDWQGSKVLLFVGALTAGKGLQDLIAAMPSVLAKHDDCELVIIGSGAFREVLESMLHAIEEGDQELWTHIRESGFDIDASDMRGAFESLPRELPSCSGIVDRVHFVGRLDHERLQHVFPCADLAVFPSVVPEAYPLVLMEALSNGVLPLVSDFSGFRDGLDELERHIGEELVSAMRLPIGDDRVPQIAEKIMAALARPIAAERLREIAVSNYDWTVRADALVSRMQELGEAPVRSAVHTAIQG